MRRVVLIGGESTGKSTLARALASRFGTAWAPEYARRYLERRGGECRYCDVPRIARGQLLALRAAEARAKARASALVFFDTDLFVTQVWSEHYFGRAPGFVRRAAHRGMADLYLLLAPDVPWVRDGLRDRPRDRAWFHRRFRGLLARHGARVASISGPHGVREERARRAVDSMCRSLCVS